MKWYHDIQYMCASIRNMSSIDAVAEKKWKKSVNLIAHRAVVLAIRPTVLRLRVFLQHPGVREGSGTDEAVDAQGGHLHLLRGGAVSCSFINGATFGGFLSHDGVPLDLYSDFGRWTVRTRHSLDSSLKACFWTRHILEVFWLDSRMKARLSPELKDVTISCKYGLMLKTYLCSSYSWMEEHIFWHMLYWYTLVLASIEVFSFCPYDSSEVSWSLLLSVVESWSIWIWLSGTSCSRSCPWLRRRWCWG